MRIGQITYTYQPITGGGDVYVNLLARVLGGAGHEVSIFQRFAPRAEDPNLHFINNPLARLKKGEFWSQALFLSGRREELLRQDLLIAHYPIYLLAAARLLQGKTSPRLIGLSHGVTWDDGRPISAAVKKALARRAFRRADGFVANDSFFLREMGLSLPPRQGLFSEVAARRWFIPNSVPPEPPAARPRPELQELKAIIVPRNFYRNRGLHLALEAFHRFAPHYPETHLVILGAKSQPAYAVEVAQRIRHLGLDDRVICWGHVKHETMEDFYASSEMCLIPSLCGEGTSLSALEAMAYGLATITTDIAGLKDLPSVKCRPQAESLAAAMLETYPRKREVGEEQKHAVSKEYSFERWAQTWLAVINQAAQG